MNIKYDVVRNAYYAGILLLVLYALPKISFINNFLYPLLNYEILVDFPVISLVALAVLVAAFIAYKYRKLG